VAALVGYAGGVHQAVPVLTVGPVPDAYRAVGVQVGAHVQQVGPVGAFDADGCGLSVGDVGYVDGGQDSAEVISDQEPQVSRGRARYCAAPVWPTLVAAGASPATGSAPGVGCGETQGPAPAVVTAQGGPGAGGSSSAGGAGLRLLALSAGGVLGVPLPLKLPE
jgi:hypothetical protein